MNENKCPMCGESYIIAKPTKWGGMEYIHGMSQSSVVSCQQSSASYKAAQQSVQPTVATEPLEDSPWQTGIRRGAVISSNRNSG